MIQEAPVATRLLNMHDFDKLRWHVEQRLVHHEKCTHSFRLTVSWLEKHNHDVRANVERFLDWYANCDCDVVDVIKREQWKQYRESDLAGPRIHGAKKWRESVNEALKESRHE